ncbi:hypothetical protein, partial [Mesorhizobium sp. M0129]|uniref:hypothetical protein n=1 Tax=unclassified Mesorhizobium TaxID=325217 RepID=UPI00333C393B
MLDGKHAGHATVEPVGPQIVARCRIDELGIEADLLAGAADAPLDNEADAKVARDVRQRCRLVLVGEHRV